MPIYQGSAIKNVFDLINRDNPSLPFPVNEDTFITGIPKAITRTAQGHDTELRLVPKTSSMYRGGLTVTYRRINLAWLFRETKPTIERFLPDASWTSLYQLLPLINQTLGMNLAEKDFDNVTTLFIGTQKPTYSRTITARGDSLMYTGTFTLTWIQGKEELGLDIMKVSELAGIQWPAGNDFVANNDRHAYGTWLFWDKHFTEEAVAQNWAAGVAGGYRWSDDANYPQLALYNAALVAQNADFNFGAFNAETNPKGLGRQQVYLITISLPNASYPEVTRQGFNYATIIYPQDATLYAKHGRAVLYFNK